MSRASTAPSHCLLQARGVLLGLSVLLAAACDEDLEAGATLTFTGDPGSAATADTGRALPDAWIPSDSPPIQDVPVPPVDDAASEDPQSPDGALPDGVPPDADLPDGAPTVDAEPPADAPQQIVCPAGVAGCVDGDRLVCNENGTAFELLPCPGELVCNNGECVECASASDCEGPGEVCAGGECALPPLAVVTTALPTGLAGASYTATLLAAGGLPPYSWSLGDAGVLPEELVLGASGTISGAPLVAGTWTIPFVVSDSAGGKASASLPLEVVEGDLVITTPSPLPKAIEGEPYSLTFAAAGGVPPYFFGGLDPLPGGLVLSPAGGLSGTPLAAGPYGFTIKAFDNGTPTLSATRPYELVVGLAPLEIIGDQEVNLFVTKLITLPLIVVVDGIPIPYSAKLQAKGGKKPYAWQELPLADIVKSFIPNSGIPKGLTLAPSGSISGAVTDPTLVTTIKIPFTQIELSGFFFSAEVKDSQQPPEKRSALFVIPTVPIGGSGGP